MMPTSALQESIREFESKKRKCLDLLSELQDASREIAVIAPTGENGRLTEESLQIATEKISGATLRILIAGQFKTGKSALVNAMLGKPALPSYATPCTAVITEVCYGEKPEAELYFKENIDKENLSPSLPEKIRSHILASETEIPPLRLNLEENANLDSLLAINDEEYGIAENPIAVCKLYWPLDLLAGDATIIDSPGLNENGARDKTTMDYVPKADVILHVLNAQQLYGLPDQQFIKTLEIMGGFPLLFVVNRYDLIRSDKEKQRVAEYAYKKLLAHTAYGERGIFFTSAEKALLGRLENKPDLLAESGVPAFEERMAEIFASERMKIKLGHIHASLRDLDFTIDDFLPRLLLALNEDHAKLTEQAKNQAAILERLDSRIQRIKNICRAEISVFQEQLQNELLSLFMRFRDTSLPQVVENTDISSYNVTDEREKSEATGLLIANIDSTMQTEMLEWQKNSGDQLFAQTMRQIQKEVEGELQDFNMLMNILDESWAVYGDAPKHEQISLGVGSNGMLLAGGIAAGGGIAGIAALALLPARFLGEFAGPIGWLVVALTTGLGAALAYWSKTVARKNLKENFLRESRRILAQDAPQWANQVSLDAANIIGENALLLIQELQKRVEDARRPVVAALEILKTNQGDIDNQKEKLAGLKDKLEKLREKAASIAQDI